MKSKVHGKITIVKFYFFKLFVQKFWKTIWWRNCNKLFTNYHAYKYINQLSINHFLVIEHYQVKQHVEIHIFSCFCSISSLCYVNQCIPKTILPHEFVEVNFDDNCTCDEALVYENIINQCACCSLLILPNEVVGKLM